MANSLLVEAQYPISFRAQDATALGHYLKNRNSVVLVGMKRVGISNFLRFFLYHKDIPTTYINDQKTHLFIPVDLNDLVERELFPFWALTFKRIVDSVNSSSLPKKTKQDIEEQFLHSIQFQDLFLLIDGIRESLLKITEQGVLPTLFLLRFDRIKNAVTPAFFDNLQGLLDATNNKVSYVFTSYRSLDQLSPEVFTKASLATFSRDHYIQPLKKEDTRMVFETYKSNYSLALSSVAETALFELVDGYVQYLQLALISLHERKAQIKTKEELAELLTHDERIVLQSEELWESLIASEREVLMRILQEKKLSKDDLEKGKYLFDTGLVILDQKDHKLFSPLFVRYVEKREQKPNGEGSSVDFSKKENLLFNFLKTNLGEICEREKLIEAVWPEVEALGVSDWAIDRLVARVRSKLKLQKVKFEIQTIKTRGYKLLEAI